MNLTAQSIEWKINMAGVETSEENDSSEKLVPKKKCTSEIWQERIQISREKTRRKCRYCVSRAENWLTLRREEMQLISTVIWNTSTWSYLKTFESVRQYPPKLLTKSQVTIREPYRQPSIKDLQMQRLRKNVETPQGINRCCHTLFS